MQLDRTARRAPTLDELRDAVSYARSFEPAAPPAAFDLATAKMEVHVSLYDVSRATLRELLADEPGEEWQVEENHSSAGRYFSAVWPPNADLGPRPCRIVIFTEHEPDPRGDALGRL